MIERGPTRADRLISNTSSLCSVKKYSSDQQAEELLKKYREREDIERSKMIDCFSEEDDPASTAAANDDQDSAEVSSSDQKTLQSHKAAAESTTTTAAATAANERPKTKPASPIKALGVVEYIVDQKGAGSESLVVKSAATNKATSAALSSSPAFVGSRRGSSLVSPPRRSLDQQQQQRHLLQNTHLAQTCPTTHSHPLFPNYTRTLPAYDTQINLAAINADLGLAALNVADFSLNTELWNASGMFPIEQPAPAAAIYDPYASFSPIDSIPRYISNTNTNTDANNSGASIYQLSNTRPGFHPVASDSTHGMSSVVSDLFSGVGMF